MSGFMKKAGARRHLFTAGHAGRIRYSISNSTDQFFSTGTLSDIAGATITQTFFGASLHIQVNVSYFNSIDNDGIDIHVLIDGVDSVTLASPGLSIANVPRSFNGAIQVANIPRSIHTIKLQAAARAGGTASVMARAITMKITDTVK